VKPAARAREVAAREGPKRRQAYREAISALEALAAMGRWPGRRDALAERQVEVVRRRWARIERRARQIAGR
jgi:hypothetical protein